MVCPILRSFLHVHCQIINKDTDTRERDGDDGSWSSFALRVGSSEQSVRVLPSTAGQETWVVSPQGCSPGMNGTSASSPCSQSRGGLFDSTQSSSWQTIGDYLLDLELNLGYNDSAVYGLDTVALGFANSIGGPTLDSQVISALATDDYYLGVFGLGNQGTNISNFTDPHSSFLTAMRNKSLIPSLSWAYTAGAPYREFVSLLSELLTPPLMTKIAATTIISRALVANQSGCVPKLGVFSVFSLYRISLSEYTGFASRNIRYEPRVWCFFFRRMCTFKCGLLLHLTFFYNQEGIKTFETKMTLTPSRIERRIWEFDIWRLRSFKICP